MKVIEIKIFIIEETAKNFNNIYKNTEEISAHVANLKDAVTYVLDAKQLQQSKN